MKQKYEEHRFGRTIDWRKFQVSQHLIQTWLSGESRQYAAFLLLWYFLRAAHSILRTVSVCFALLFVLADQQELAPTNFALILELGFYSTVFYCLASLLLFLLVPGSYIMQGLQEYLETHKHWVSKMHFARRQALDKTGEGTDYGASHSGFKPYNKPSQAAKHSRWILQVLGHLMLRRGNENSKVRQQSKRYRFLGRVKLQYQLWFKLPLRSMFYLLEISLALVWGGILYALFLAQKFSLLF